MTSISFNFEVHQPFRMATFQPNGNIYNGDVIHHYFNHGLDKWVFDRVANRCYFPSNKIMLELIDQLKHEKKKFKISYSISGVFLELCETFNKDLLETFKQLSETKCVEFLGQTYYHSLASLFDHKAEFTEQVNMHRQTIKDLLKFTPNVFVNTELIYNNLIAKIVEDLGFEGIFTEGTEKVLGWRSPNYVYARKFCFPGDSKAEKRIKVLLRNYRLSDDIGYRFSAKDWNQWPLTTDKYASWLSATPGQCINLFMDYETFGEHQWQESGIFWFLKSLPFEILKYDNLEFSTPSEIIKSHEQVGEVDVFELSTVSWADIERDTSAWLGNRMQQLSFGELKNLEQNIKKLNNPGLMKAWRLLQISDHLYYICTKCWNDGDVHKYFSCFPTPQDGFVNFMTIISDLRSRVLTELMKANSMTK